MYLLYTMYFGLLLLIELEIVLSVRRWNILGLQTASIYAWIRLPGGRTLSMLGLPRPPPWISDSNHVVLWSRERDGGWPFLTSFTMKQSSSQPVNCQALTALWGVHKLRWQDFLKLFWPPIYPLLTFVMEFLYCYKGKSAYRWRIQYHIPLSSCQRGLWMPPAQTGQQ